MVSKNTKKKFEKQLKKWRKEANTGVDLGYQYGYPEEEIWNTGTILAREITTRLYAFRAYKKHGYPSGMKGGEREWDQTIKKMIDAFELLKYECLFSTEEEKTISEGLELFCKYFRNLWD